MYDIKLLDCTLRDGGYVVDAKFGRRRICGMIEKLEKAHVDIIECGFLRSSKHKGGESEFHMPEEVEPYLPAVRNGNTSFVLMYDCGKYNVSELPDFNGGMVCGIRDCFHKEFLCQAVADAELLIKKGYQTFIQPTGIVGYTRDELLSLVDTVNRLHPYAFSLVDTFGSMYKDDLLQFVDIVSERLAPDIYFGFHSHNNLQLSFALTQDFIDVCAAKGRKVIVDATLYGMGRGAGNTNTELMMDFLNRKYQKSYDIDEILDLLDLYMKSYIQKHEWGYTLPYFVAGKYGSHVDNINYLLTKGNMLTKDMRQVVSEMSAEDRKHYHPEILESLYLDHITSSASAEMGNTVEQVLKTLLAGKEVLVIAPGKSADVKRAEILNYIKGHPEAEVITLNFVDLEFSNKAFFGNVKRYEVWKNLEQENFDHILKIVTSNVCSQSGKKLFSIPQASLVQTGWKYFDLSSMMVIRLLTRLGAAKISIAGMDGFSKGQMDDHFTEIMNTYLPQSEYAKIDEETLEMLEIFYKENQGTVKLEFITPSIYETALKETEGSA